MSEMVVVTEERPFILSIRINRIEVYNALSFDLLDELSATLDRLGAQKPRVLILTGSGKSFCSGADLKEIKGFSPETAAEFSRRGNRVFDALESFPCPVIAAVNGYAFGGGCELACSCDLIYASDAARFGQPEARVGMITGWGGTHRLARRIGLSRAKKLFFTARTLEAQSALELGLCDAVYPATEFWSRVVEAAEEIAKNAPIAIRLEKELMNRAGSYGAPGYPAAESEAVALRQCVESEDQTEGIAAFLEKREPEFQDR